METTLTHVQMHSIQAEVNSLIPTKVLECGGELSLDKCIGQIESESEIEETAAEIDWLELKSSLEARSVVRLKQVPQTDNGTK